jgi:hypothetical protein
MSEIKLDDSQKEFIKESLENLLEGARRNYILCKGTKDEKHCIEYESDCNAILILSKHIGIELKDWLGGEA